MSAHRSGPPGTLDAEIIGDSPGMLDVRRLIEGVAPTPSTVLLLGESGTGKELVARAIHRSSPRAARPFVAVQCGAIPKELVESELFGPARGAFTGDQTARAGLFETADGGTILLEEVGELPLAAQVRLLRVLQEGESGRVGVDETRTVDVRVLAATNVDLASRLRTGELRRELYDRLNVLAISLPALRERGDDVLLLANHYLQKFARSTERPPKRLSPDAVDALRRYDWPGNVRELGNAIERAVVRSSKDVVTSADLQLSRGAGAAPPEPHAGRMRSLLADLAILPYPEAKRRLLALFDETYTRELLRRADGNMSEAARQAGLDRSNFRRLLRRRKDDP